MIKKIINDRIYSYFSIPSDVRKIVIYCHGFGESKERINQHYEVLNNGGMGIVSFDFPCHGEDESDDLCFNLSNSLDYLDKVIESVKGYNVPICLMGSSYGGYIALSYINRFKVRFDRVFLKYPAVNFYECTKRKLGIDIDYFNNHDFYTFINGRKYNRSAFLEFMNDNLMDSFDRCDNNIFIIHGDKDKTVLLSDVKYFCDKYDIKLDVIYGAEHGMRDYLDLVNEKLLDFIK
jgi:hypothetical protein